jgi:hypothetical protein
MHIKDVKIGMKLKANSDYADCILAGDEFEVFEIEGSPHITCRCGPHDLPSTAVEDEDDPAFGQIPELEPAFDM